MIVSNTNDEIKDVLEIDISVKKDIWDMSFFSNPVVCTSFALYEEPVNLLICGTGSGKLVIFDTHTFKIITKNTKSSFKHIYHVLKWSQDYFIVCDQSKEIKCFSTKSSYRYIKSFNLDRATAYKSVRLNDDWLCVQGYTDDLIIFSFSKNELVKKINAGRFSCTDIACFQLSQKYKNGLYLNTREAGYAVKLVDYKKDVLIKSFSCTCEIWAFSVFESPKTNEEMLVICHDSKNGGMVYMYRTSDKKYDKGMKLEDMDRTTQYKGSATFGRSIYSCFVLEGQYLFCGNWEGEIDVYGIKDEGLSSIKAFGVHRKVIWQMYMMRDGNVVTLGSDGAMKLCQIKGLVFKEKVEELDEKERIHFLMEDVESFVFGDKESVFVKLRFGSFSIESCFKSFLCFE